jgi:hypothetical protein
MNRLWLRLSIALILLAASALAADMTGKWVGEMSGPEGGGGFTITYNFKQDGAKLTGTVEGPGGEPMQVKEGKVEGDKFSFIVSFEGGPNGAMKITNEGTVNGDEAKMTSKFEGGDFPPSTIVLKRAK